MENKIGLSIKKHRISIGLTQRELAVKVWPGDDPDLARARVAKYEIGLAMPPTDVYLKIMSQQGE